MPSLFPFDPSPHAPHIDRIHPHAAMPAGEVAVYGRNLGPFNGQMPSAAIGDTPARALLSRSAHAILRVAEGSIPGEIVIERNGELSNGALLQVAVPMAENLHPVANPAVDAEGNVFTTLSGRVPYPLQPYRKGWDTKTLPTRPYSRSSP